MYFRPYPILTFIAIPALAALITLGVWQSQRAEWKAQLISRFEQAAKADPQPPEAVLCGGKTEAGVVVSPPVGVGKALRMFGHDASGVAGWRLFQAVTLPCGPVLAETGFEVLDIGGPGAALPVVREAKPAARFLIEPWPEKPLMAADNAPDRNEWHWFDATGMAADLGVPALSVPFILTPLSGMPDFLTRTPPETHIGYAVTWFGMAIAFAVIYALFHVRAGRLRFGKDRE
ncbi:MAG: SURF1 family protein [Hyphomonadaceae bacterium]